MFADALETGQIALSAPALRLRGLSKSFGSLWAVRDLDLEVGPGEIVALIGESGCGKTTTLRLVAGLEMPDAGTVEIAGRDCSSVPPERRGTGLVFQDYALFPHLDVAANVRYGLYRLPRAQRRLRMREVLELVGLEALERRMPVELSGGQQQRVALARALAPSPSILLLDEPFSNLDPRLRRQVRHDVVSIIRSSGAAALWVTHDHDEGLIVSDRVAVMNAGGLRQVGTPADIWWRPADAWVAGFIGHGDLIAGRVESGHVSTPLGQVALRDGQKAGLAEGRQVQVLVRPDDVVLDRRGHSGVVVRRHFSGSDNVYCIRLHEEGELLHFRQPASVEIPRGTTVAIRLGADSLPVFP